ncbi:MAG: type IV pilus modification PilV family protein, partial [Planctomycetota bacterium]
MSGAARERAGEAGFSLIEVVVALGVLMLGIGSVLALL